MRPHKKKNPDFPLLMREIRVQIETYTICLFEARRRTIRGKKV
jgi:hypothetical protein